MPAIHDHRPGGRRRGTRRVPNALRELVPPRPDAARRRSRSARPLPRADFQGRFSADRRLRAPRRRCATGWIRWTRCRRAWCACSAAAIPYGLASAGELDDFWIDKFEVTNRQFKEFVDQGGYRRRDYWREPFIEGGRSLPWEEAIARFRDATGQPGPATWRVRNVSRRSRRLSCRRRELVRGRGVRGVRRQEPADDPSLVPCGAPRALR